MFNILEIILGTSKQNIFYNYKENSIKQIFFHKRNAMFLIYNIN